MTARVALIACLFLATSLAGCHGLDEKGNTTADASQNDAANGDASDVPPVAPTTPATTPPATPSAPAAPTYTLTVNGAPATVQVDTAIMVTVDVAGGSGSVTGPEIGYAASAFPAPSGAAGSAVKTIAGSPATFSAPGQFSVSGWKFPSAGTWHFRAHVVVDGVHTWGESATIEVTAAPPKVEQVDGPADVTVTITIGGTNAGWDPDPVTIQVGQKVAWDNTDLSAHTVTESSGALWDSGNVAAGATSASFQFNAAGTYTYHCIYHRPNMDGARVIVQ